MAEKVERKDDNMSDVSFNFKFLFLVWYGENMGDDD